MMVSDQLFEAYLRCNTKAYLQFFTEHRRFCRVNPISEWQRQIRNEYSRAYVETLVSKNPTECIFCDKTKDRFTAHNYRWIAGLEISADHLVSNLPLLENTSLKTKSKKGNRFTPVRLFPSEKIDKNQRHLLAFDALVLGKTTDHFPTIGKIVHGREQIITQIRLTTLIPKVELISKEILTMLEKDMPPNFSLIRHCFECEFQSQCKERAIKEDNISLLRVIPPKEIAKLKSKGIFTVTQFSYTFRPRRRKAKAGVHKVGKYQYALKALAIREKTTYVVGSPNLKLDGTLVYLDVEGVPEQELYYLIGSRVVFGKCKMKRSFWANDKNEEERIWHEFIKFIESLENPVLLHYGSYETTFLKNMQSRYGTKLENGFDISPLLSNAINVLSIIYKHIYFPTYTNGLKDIAIHLGFSWSTDNPSGLNSLVLRSEWERTNDKKLKQELLTYNEDDCKALEIVVNAITVIEQKDICATSISSKLNAVQIESIRNASWPFLYGKKEFAFSELAYITKCAYWDYQRDKIYVRTNKRIKAIAKKHKASKKTCSIPINKVEKPIRPSRCPNCASVRFAMNGRHERTISDLRFVEGGIKRWVTKNIIDHYKCVICRSTFVSDNVLVPRYRYGSQIFAYVIYNLIELHIAQNQVSKIIKKNFGIPLSQSAIGIMKERAAELYGVTFQEIKTTLLQGALIHADETRVSVVGEESYVWVFTSMEEVVYIWSDTREAKTAKDFLTNFSGVLVSDFYTAYDAIDCLQQKCLIHLIRDLNDALLKEPFNEEMKALVKKFAELLRKIIATVDKYGLKKYFLRKHISDVEQFYKMIEEHCYVKESARKLQKRFKKNRYKLFTFLEFNDVPWNNNNAEHAVKAFGRGIRGNIDGRTSEQGIKDYLKLLSIYQTCEYRGIDFLQFLRSGVTRLSAFSN